MGAVIHLAHEPDRVRTLQAIRSGINERAQRLHASERKRLCALGLAREVFDAGAPSGWAIQAGWQFLRGDRVTKVAPAEGGAA
jgi:hypothetical protein